LGAAGVELQPGMHPGNLRTSRAWKRACRTPCSATRPRSDPDWGIYQDPVYSAIPAVSRRAHAPASAQVPAEALAREGEPAPEWELARGSARVGLPGRDSAQPGPLLLVHSLFGAPLKTTVLRAQSPGRRGGKLAGIPAVPGIVDGEVVRIGRVRKLVLEPCPGLGAGQPRLFPALLCVHVTLPF
jgi:hypothetical protein